MSDAMPEPLMLVAVAALGLAVGSFLNVCIYRLPRGESLVLPASHCTSCGRSLQWYENVPVLSYLALGGRCRTCGVPISPVYPLIEIAAAVVAVVWYRQFGPSVVLASRLVFACALLVLFMIDLRHHVLPNIITLPGIAIGFVFSLFTPSEHVLGPPGQPAWHESLIGLLAGGGFLYLLAEAWRRIRHEEAMGMGDVKMLGMIGAFLGWKLMVFTLMLASLMGSVVGLGMIAAGKGSRKSQLPFGTFLALAALVACVIGKAAVGWYIDRVWR